MSGFVEMMQDEEIREIVLEHLKWSPRVNATHIGVGVRGGVVELSGRVETFAEKLEAEHVALAVKGVRGVAQEIVVRLPTEKRTSDEELAERGARLLAWDSRLEGVAVKVKVERGWVTLSGEVRSAREREVALSNVKRLSGVLGVTNAITLRGPAAPTDVKARIEEALGRQALLQADFLHVSFQEGTVVLSGKVHSWAERVAARQTVWEAPGVTDVIDNIHIEPR